MKQSFKIEGMSCQNCVRSISAKIASLPSTSDIQVQLVFPQLTLESQAKLSNEQLKAILPMYTFSKTDSEINITSGSFLETYKPLILIVAFITLVSFLVQYPLDDFSWMLFMRHFMAGFFIVFSFFKFLNLSGFAQSFANYDLISRRWFAWGYVYPFLELALGICFLINFNPNFSAISTIVLLGISSVGVIQSNLNKEKIQCACLGDVFNLPMSVVTIIEDVAMIAMAVVMLMFNS